MDVTRFTLSVLQGAHLDLFLVKDIFSVVGQHFSTWDLPKEGILSVVLRYLLTFISKKLVLSIYEVQATITLLGNFFLARDSELDKKSKEGLLNTCVKVQQSSLCWASHWATAPARAQENASQRTSSLSCSPCYPIHWAGGKPPLWCPRSPKLLSLC